MILNNYDGSQQQVQKKKGQDHQPEIQEAAVDFNNFDHTANELNINTLRNEDKDSSKNEGAVDEDRFQWTQEKDELLINNYPNFESLGKHACYEMLAMLLPDTTARSCYERGKKLHLKKVSADEARQRSRKLISDQSHNLTDKKVVFALQKFIL